MSLIKEPNRLERLTLESLSSQVWFFRVRPRVYPIGEQSSGHLAIPANIRPARKGLLVIGYSILDLAGKDCQWQTLKLITKFIIYGQKSFITFAQVYDVQLVDPLCQLWALPVETGSASLVPDVSGSSLLRIPTGGATVEGLEHNIAVIIL